MFDQEVWINLTPCSNISWTQVPLAVDDSMRNNARQRPALGRARWWCAGFDGEAFSTSSGTMGLSPSTMFSVDWRRGQPFNCCSMGCGWRSIAPLSSRRPLKRAMVRASRPMNQPSR